MAPSEKAPGSSFPRYCYKIRHFKIEGPDGYHECHGNVIAVLSSSYSQARDTWYITVMVKQMQIRDNLHAR